MGKRVAFFTTAPAGQEGLIRAYLEERWGCIVELFCCHLGDRRALAPVLAGAALGRVDAVLTEIKAAAIDMVAERASALGLPVIPVDNQPVEVAPATPAG